MKLVIQGISKIEAFKALVSQLQLLVTNFRFITMKDYVYIQGMDSGHVTLHDIILKREWFAEYVPEARNGKDCEISVLISTFGFIIKTCGTKGDTIEINTEDSETTLNIYVRTEGKKDTVCYEYHIPMIDLDMDLMGIPDDQEYPLLMKCKTSILTDNIKQLLAFGDNVEMECLATMINMSSGSEKGSLNIKIPVSDMKCYEIEDGVNLNVSYSLKYLTNLFSSTLSDMVTICVSKDIPILIIYELDTIGSKVCHYLAPRVDDMDTD